MTKDKLTRIITPRRFCKIYQMNYENSTQQNMALHSVFAQMSELYQIKVYIPTSMHRCILTSHIILYCMKRSLHKCSLTLGHIDHTRTNNGFFKLVEVLL